jgi:hypothetical protein
MSFGHIIAADGRRAALLLVVAVLLYGIIAYVALPSAWTHYEHQKRLEGLPMITRTVQGMAGDPLNVGLVGTEEDVLCALHAAGWYPADPITWRSSLRIIGSVLLHRPYPSAPVSNLTYEGRREDLAFERPFGKSASRRHHVRFWQVLASGQEARPVWLGAATFDRGVGLSLYTGQVTHRIAPDVDAERDVLTADLVNAHVVKAIYQVSGIGPTLRGRNGEGNKFYTDGEIKISRLVGGCGNRTATTVRLDDPPLVELNDAIWSNVIRKLQSSDADPGAAPSSPPSK